MRTKKSRAYITRFNQQRINALKADLNANLPQEQSPLTQDDALNHLFEILKEYTRLKKENYELKNKLASLHAP